MGYFGRRTSVETIKYIKEFEIDINEDESEVHEITMICKVRNWSEPHPYGGTYAYEDFSEIEEQEFELNGVGVELEEIIIRFGDKGKKVVDELTKYVY